MMYWVVALTCLVTVFIVVYYSLLTLSHSSFMHFSYLLILGVCESFYCEYL